MQRRTWFSSLSTAFLVLLFGVASAQAATESIAIALSVHGTVEVNEGPDQWAPLAFGAVLNDSDQVRTGADGFLALAFTDDGTQIKLRPNTSVMLGATRAENIALAKKVSLQVGELLSDVKQQKGTMEVETPTSVASVKGTEFWTLVDGSGGTTIITTEGLVGLYNIISGTSMDVPAGQYGTSSASGRISVRPLSPAVTIPTWEPEEEQQEEPQQPEPEDQEQDTGGPEQGGGGTGEGEGGGGGGGGLGIGGAVGATTIDGVNYQYFSLRPDIPIWKFGIGLDLGFYFDADGNLRKEDWDEAADIIDKIYYLRYGQKGDPTYVRVGNLDEVTLGYGMIMRRYSNSIEWPQVRRIGMHAQKKIGPFGLEAVVNNFREIETPGLVGLRATFEMKLGLPIVFGATAVGDGNLYLGARDTDGDGIPDPFDLWPGEDDIYTRDYISGLNLSQAQIDELIALGVLPSEYLSPAINIGDSTQSVMEFGVDVGVPLINREHMALWLYGQMAQIEGYGTGITAPGMNFRLGPFRMGAEYRIFGKEFMPEFFNYGYEVERVVWDDSTGMYVTKKDRLTGLPSAQGIFVDAGLNLMNWFDVYAAYQQMTYGDIEENGVVTVEGSSIPNKTFYAQASINTEVIPKLGLAEAYYQQPQAENLLDATDGSTVGYRVGLEMGGGFMLVMDNKSIYRNGAWEKLMTVETQFTF